MRAPEDVIIRPFITEKSTQEVAAGKYTFIVDYDATKTEIRQAAEKLFQVKVLDVNTAKYRGKTKRLGVHIGNRPKWKKAVIKIDLNPEPERYLAKGGKEIVSQKKYKTSIEEYGVTQ